MLRNKYYMFVIQDFLYGLSKQSTKMSIFAENRTTFNRQ